MRNIGVNLMEREYLKQWAHEIHDMGLVMREALFVGLPAIETENE